MEKKLYRHGSLEFLSWRNIAKSNRWLFECLF